MKSKTLASAVRGLSLLLLVSGTCALAQDYQASAPQRPDQRLFALEWKCQRQPMGDAWSMVDGHSPGMGHRRLLSGYDNVRLWENHDGCCRSDTAPCEPSHAPHQVDERQDHLGHDRLPHLPYPRPHNGLSVERHGQPDDGEWKQIAPFETDPPSSTLQVCVTGGNEVPYSQPEFEHYAGLRWTRDDALRAAGSSMASCVSSISRLQVIRVLAIRGKN